MSRSNTSSSGIGVMGLLGLLFIGLKLGGVINWSWWYVTMPFWGGLAAALGLVAIVGIVGLIWALCAAKSFNKVWR